MGLLAFTHLNRPSELASDPAQISSSALSNAAPARLRAISGSTYTTIMDGKKDLSAAFRLGYAPGKALLDTMSQAASFSMRAVHLFPAAVTSVWVKAPEAASIHPCPQWEVRRRAPRHNCGSRPTQSSRGAAGYLRGSAVG